MAHSAEIARVEWAGPQLDNLHKKEDEDDEQDEADAAASVVAEARSHAIATKAKHQNQNEQKDKHLVFSPFGEISPDGGVMQILLHTQYKSLWIGFERNCFW